MFHLTLQSHALYVHEIVFFWSVIHCACNSKYVCYLFLNKLYFFEFNSVSLLIQYLQTCIYIHYKWKLSVFDINYHIQIHRCSKQWKSPVKKILSLNLEYLLALCFNIVALVLAPWNVYYFSLIFSFSFLWVVVVVFSGLNKLIITVALYIVFCLVDVPLTLWQLVLLSTIIGSISTFAIYIVEVMYSSL